MLSKKYFTGVLIFSLCILLVSGCTAAQKGAGIGAVAGAGLGGIIGHQSGHGGEGAAIGAVAGAVTGGLIGNSMEYTKFCPKCGKKFKEDKQYCPYDGTELKPVQK